MPELRPLSPEKTMLRIIGSGVSFPFKFSEAGRVNSVSVSKGVQKVNQSIHSILTTRKGERIFMPEFGCLSGDTVIPLLDGTEKPLRELVGTPVWMYGCDSGRVVPAFSPGAVFQGFKNTVRVTLDDGSSLVVTPDHKFLMRDGTYREAESLSPGDSLMPLYRRLNKRGYEETLVPSLEKWIPTHRLGVNPGKGKVVHHRDFNKRNNTPSNLVCLGKEEHIQLHADQVARMFEEGAPLDLKWKDQSHRDKMRHVAKRNLLLHNNRVKNDPEYRERVRTSKWVEERRISSRKRKSAWWEAHPERRSTKPRNLPPGVGSENQSRVGKTVGVANCVAWAKSDAGRAHARRLGKSRSKGVTQEAILRFAASVQTSSSRGDLTQQVLTNFGISLSTLKRITPLSSLGRLSVTNHKVVSVEPNGVEGVYDLVNSTTGNFATGAGVFVSNSNLHLLVFEPLDDFLYPQLRVETAEALRRWERRIRVTGISFVSPREVSAETLLQLGTPPEAITRLQERSWIGIFIQYEILQYHVKGAYIYPFELAALPFEQTTGRTSIGGA